MRTLRRPRLFLALILTISSVSAFAQSSVYQPGTPLMMYKVSSKTNTAYLLGSVHLAEKSLYPLPAVIENAFASSSVLLVEVDMAKVDHEQLKELMTNLGMYPEGDDLYEHISADTRAKLNDYFSAYDIPPDAFAKTRPWMISLMAVMMPMVKAGLDPNEGIDMYFLQKAGNKPVEQLEDAAFQVKLLATFPDKDADRAILHALKQAQLSLQTMSQISSYWSRGDAEKMDQLVATMSADDTPDEKALGHRLREDRNPHMTERLEKCLQSSEKCFMVVGALHVIGSEGIVKQLQAHGYKVEQAVVEAPAARSTK